MGPSASLRTMKFSRRLRRSYLATHRHHNCRSTDFLGIDEDQRMRIFWNASNSNAARARWTHLTVRRELSAAKPRLSAADPKPAIRILIWVWVLGAITILILFAHG